MKKILISGDSFAADWTKKYDGIGWVNMLENDFLVTNVAEAGVSEFKIYQQLQRNDIESYDKVIISHTSAYRIPVYEHPIHSKDSLHKNCDLIYSDLKEHKNNKLAKIGIDFYENLFHFEYFIFTYNLIMDKIIKEIPNSINISFFDSFVSKEVMCFEEIFLKNKGLINHMNDKGNNMIYKKIKKLINE
jgi:hypothetical protein